MARSSLQGQQAVWNGHDREEEMEQVLRAYGYGKCPEALEARDQPCFVPKYTGALRNLYGKPMLVDFYLWHPRKYPHGLLIDLKFQAWQGSVCEKLPYTVLSLKGSGVPALLVLSGGGFKPQALAWCEQQQDPGRFWVRHHVQGHFVALMREFL